MKTDWEREMAVTASSAFFLSVEPDFAVCPSRRSVGCGTSRIVGAESFESGEGDGRFWGARTNR